MPALYLSFTSHGPAACRAAHESGVRFRKAQARGLDAVFGTHRQVAVTNHDREDPDDTVRWVACGSCEQLEHPEPTCDQAIELVRSAALRELLRTQGPVLLAALEDAADERAERARGACADCARSPEGGMHGSRDRPRAGYRIPAYP